MGQSGKRSPCAGFVRLKECLACSLWSGGAPPTGMLVAFGGCFSQYRFAAQSANS